MMKIRYVTDTTVSYSEEVSFLDFPREIQAECLMTVLPYRIKARVTAALVEWLDEWFVPPEEPVTLRAAKNQIFVDERTCHNKWSMISENEIMTFSFFFEDEAKAVEFKLRFG